MLKKVFTNKTKYDIMFEYISVFTMKGLIHNGYDNDSENSC